MSYNFSINVSKSEAIRRYIVGGALIGAVLVLPTMVPSWIALFACYPVFTAMVQWDPANALLEKAVASIKSREVEDAVFYRPVSIRTNK